MWTAAYWPTLASSPEQGLAQDVGGSITATMPFESDLKSPEVGECVEKYLHGVEGVSTENRMCMARSPRT